MALMMVLARNYNEGRKVLNYLKCIKNSNSNVNVYVFKQMIKINGVT